MALTDLTRISTAGIATGSTIDSPILRKDVNFRGNQVGVTSILFDSSEKRLDLKDNVNLTFGDDGDLKLYHSGSHSYIDETGTGNLYIRNGNKNSIWCKTGGQVNLYFNDEKKFETAETGAKVTGILTATSFSGPIVGNTNNSSGISTFYDLRVSNNLTVEGTTTTIDTNLIGVDRVEVGANSSTDVAVSIAQTGSADIINLFDGNTEVLTVTDGGNVGIGLTNPTSKLQVADGHINLSSGYSLQWSDSHERIEQSDSKIEFFTNNGQKMTLSSDNLGIGTISPLRKLDVVGNSILVRPTADNISSSGNANAVNNSIIVRMPYGENAASTSNAGARFGIQFTGANNTTDISSLNFGNDPVKSASIYGVSEDDLGYNRKVGMVFYTSNFDIAQRERLRIAPDGKVAMGLTSTSGGKCDPDGNHLLIRAASTFQTTKGHIMLTGDGATNGEGPQIVFSESGSGSNFAGAYIGHVRKGGNSLGDLVFATRQAVGDVDTVPVEALRITSSGNVGIGTDDPTEKLDVRGYLVVAEKIAVNRSRIVLSAPDGGNYRHLFGANLKVTDNGTFTTPTANISGGGWEYLPANSLNTHGKIRYLSAPDTNATSSTPEERLRIDGAGRMLIGLESSTQSNSYMQVFKKTGDETTITVGNVATSASGMCRIDFAPSNQAVGARIQCHATEDFSSVGNRTADLAFITRKDGTNSEKLRIKSDGKVGIGYTIPNAKLHLSSGTSSAVGDATNPAFQIGNTTNYRFAIHTTNEEAIIANKNGDDGISFHTKAPGGSFGEALNISSTGGTKLTRTTVGGQESLGNTTNLWWKVGTWAGSGVDAAARATLTVLGANTHNANNPAGGETKIYLSGTGSTIYATYYSITDKHEGLNGVATKYDQSSSSCEVWVRYGSGGYGSNCVYADVTSGFFTGANQNTSSTTLPSGATLGSSKFSVRTSDNSNSKERLAIDPYGAVTIPGQQTGISTSTAQPDAPLQVITGGNGNAVNLRARSADNAYAYINFQDNVGSKTASEIHMFRNSQNGGQLVFGTCVNDANYPTKRLTINKDGTFIVGDHDQTALAVHQGSSRGLNATVSGRVYCKTDDHWDLNHVGTGEIIRFRKGNDSNSTQTHVGQIEILSSGVDYKESASDSRLKKNVETWADEVLPHFKTLQPKKFNFNWESDSDTKNKGYMAQDVTSAFPEAFSLSKIDIGETDSNGDPIDSDRYMFSPGKMVPYLMKALQEEIAKREALEARISALEGS